MKLCKDCKWCRPDSRPNRDAGLEFAKCGRVKLDPVSGGASSYCSIARGDYGWRIFGMTTCGPNAKYWEPA